MALLSNWLIILINGLFLSFVSSSVSSQDGCYFNRLTKLQVSNWYCEGLFALKSFIFQPEMSRSALVSTSTDRMLSSKYLRVTLKSLTPIKRFVMKAVSESEPDMAGLGTWYLPFQDNTLSPTSRYLNCSDSSHNTVINSPDIQAASQTVLYFQWMPDWNYEGYVRFRSIVVTGNNLDWEEATPIEVKIIKKEKSSSPTQRPNESSTSEDSLRENTTLIQSETEDPSVIYVDTTRWSHSHSHPHTHRDSDIGGGSSTLMGQEKTSSGIMSRVTESYERLEAEHGGWRKSRNGAETFLPNLKVNFFPLYLFSMQLTSIISCQ